MFEVWRDYPDGRSLQGIHRNLTTPFWRNLVGFVNDEKPVAARVERVAGARQGLAEELQGTAVPLFPEPFHGSD